MAAIKLQGFAFPELREQGILVGGLTSFPFPSGATLVEQKDWSVLDSSVNSSGFHVGNSLANRRLSTHQTKFKLISNQLQVGIIEGSTVFQDHGKSITRFGKRDKAERKMERARGVVTRPLGLCFIVIDIK